MGLARARCGCGHGVGTSCSRLLSAMVFRAVPRTPCPLRGPLWSEVAGIDLITQAEGMYPPQAIAQRRRRHRRLPPSRRLAWGRGAQAPPTTRRQSGCRVTSCATFAPPRLALQPAQVCELVVMPLVVDDMVAIDDVVMNARQRCPLSPPFSLCAVVGMCMSGILADRSLSPIDAKLRRSTQCTPQSKTTATTSRERAGWACLAVLRVQP